MREKVRWWIARQINRLSGQCWADLVSWVLADKRGRRDWLWRERLPWTNQRQCRKDLARVGCCYCGKLRAPDEDSGIDPVFDIYGRSS